MGGSTQPPLFLPFLKSCLGKKEKHFLRGTPYSCNPNIHVCLVSNNHWKGLSVPTPQFLQMRGSDPEVDNNLLDIHTCPAIRAIKKTRTS